MDSGTAQADLPRKTIFTWREFIIMTENGSNRCASSNKNKFS